MPEPSPADSLEARSRAYAQDTYLIRQLASGWWAVYSPQREVLGIVPSLSEVPPLLVPLQRLAAAALQRAADEREALLRRVAEQPVALDLSLDLDNLELDI